MLQDWPAQGPGSDNSPQSAQSMFTSTLPGSHQSPTVTFFGAKSCGGTSQSSKHINAYNIILLHQPQRFMQQPPPQFLNSRNHVIQLVRQSKHRPKSELATWRSGKKVVGEVVRSILPTSPPCHAETMTGGYLRHCGPQKTQKMGIRRTFQDVPFIATNVAFAIDSRPSMGQVKSPRTYR